MCDVQLLYPLRSQLHSGFSSQLSAVAVSEYPFAGLRIVKNIYSFSSMDVTDVMAPIVEGDQARLVDAPLHDIGRKVLGHPRPLPGRLLDIMIIGPTRMDQPRIVFHPTEPVPI